MSVTDRNGRRIARMSTWISHAEAEAISGEEEAHIRFLFYRIAYEAAYHMNEPEDRRSWVTGCSGRFSPMATGRMERASGEVTA